MSQALMFLLKLAWDCRYRLPLLITVGFMALDIRMQLDVHVYMRTVRRQPPPNPVVPGRDRTLSQESGTSWMTLEEASTDDDEGEMMDSDGELNVTNGDREDMSDHAELDLSRVRDVPSLGYSVAGRDA